MSKHEKPGEQESEGVAVLTFLFAKLRSIWKSIVAGLVPFISLFIFMASDDGVREALPENWKRFVLVIGIPIATALLTWLKRNQPTITEAEKALADAKIRGI